MIARETDLAKQESSTPQDSFNHASSSSTTTSWSRLKDPRIVRVCRAFGGKDRHSKVCTVKGLRDRRVRLSVPTAIQLYDLQDRLGLNQPSKVVDWLLNAAKNEIDELPPLQFPQGSLFPMVNNSSYKQCLSGKLPKEASEEGGRSTSDDQEGRVNSQFNLGMNNQENYESFPSSRQNPSSLTTMMSGSSYPTNSFVRWDPSNLTLSHPPSSPPPHQPPQEWHNFSLVPMQPTSSHHPVLVYQPNGMSVQPYFHSQISSSYAEFDAKNLNFQSSVQVSTPSLTSPTAQSSSIRPAHFNMSTANLLPSQNNDES